MITIDLRRFRKANRLSQTQLAKELGILQGFVSQMENGGRPIPDSIMEKIINNKTWDTSMVIECDNSETRLSASARGGSKASINMDKEAGSRAAKKFAEELADLRSENALLKAQIVRLEEQVAMHKEQNENHKQEKDKLMDMVHQLLGKISG